MTILHRRQPPFVRPNGVANKFGSNNSDELMAAENGHDVVSLSFRYRVKLVKRLLRHDS
jgi:hypothetical protein